MDIVAVDELSLDRILRCVDNSGLAERTVRPAFGSLAGVFSPVLVLGDLASTLVSGVFIATDLVIEDLFSALSSGVFSGLEFGVFTEDSFISFCSEVLVPEEACFALVSGVLSVGVVTFDFMIGVFDSEDLSAALASGVFKVLDSPCVLEIGLLEGLSTRLVDDLDLDNLEDNDLSSLPVSWIADSRLVVGRAVLDLEGLED